MSEWKEYNITEVCDTISDTYRDCADKVVLINTSDVLEGKVTNHEPEPNKNLAGQFKKKFQRDDILYSEIRPANRRYAYVDFDPIDYIASTKLMVLRSKPCILPKYLYYLLTNNETIRNLHAIAVGRSGTFPQITYSELANIRFLLPSIDEQKEILSTILSLDDKIAVNKKICENLVAQAQALFKHWFVDFAPFKDGKFVESELGMIPEGWRVGTLEDICIFQNGHAFKSNEFTESGLYKLITIKGVQDGYLSIEGAVNIDKAPSNMKHHCFLKEKDILLSLTGNVGRVCFVDRPDLLLNQRVAKLAPVSEAYWGFIYTYMRKKSTQNIMINLAKGTAQANLSPIETAQLKISLPTKEVISNFADIVNRLYLKLILLRQENIRLATLRDTLLPKLMSGQIKL